MKQNWISISDSQYVIDEILRGRLTRYTEPIIPGFNDDYLLECYNGKPLYKSNISCPDSSEFPYIISKDLVFLIIDSGIQTCINYIKSIHAQKGKNGFNTWDLVFEIEPLSTPVSLKISKKNADNLLVDFYSNSSCLLVWDPTDGNFSESDYENYFNERYVLSWFVEAWKNPHKGGICFLLRKGDFNSGIVMVGEFLSDSKKVENWNCSTAVKYLADIKCIDMIHPDGITPLPINKLKEEFGGIDWENAYSGMEIPTEMSSKLLEIWRNK